MLSAARIVLRDGARNAFAALSTTKEIALRRAPHGVCTASSARCSAVRVPYFVLRYRPDAWVHEPKLDGYRPQVAKEGRTVRLFSRRPVRRTMPHS